MIYGMMPDTIKIGPVTYKVLVIDDLHKIDDEGRKVWLHGHILQADAEIRVANDQADDVKVITVWHEVIHGILYNAGQKEHPEGLIEAISAGLVQLIRDNPALIALTVSQSFNPPTNPIPESLKVNGNQHPTLAP